MTLSRNVLAVGCLAFLGLLAWPATAADQNPYEQPMKAERFSVRAYVEDREAQAKAEAMGLGRFIETVAPEKAPAMEIQVVVKDYLPRALSPTLLVDGEPASTRYRIVESDDGQTTIGFLVEKVGLLKDGRRLSVRYGEDARTESKAKGVFKYREVEILGAEDARKAGIIR